MTTSVEDVNKYVRNKFFLSDKYNKDYYYNLLDVDKKDVIRVSSLEYFSESPLKDYLLENADEYNVVPFSGYCEYRRKT